MVETEGRLDEMNERGRREMRVEEGDEGHG